MVTAVHLSFLCDIREFYGSLVSELNTESSLALGIPSSFSPTNPDCVCYFQHRNRFGRIFGGFLMRQAIELGWANAMVARLVSTLVLVTSLTACSALVPCSEHSLTTASSPSDSFFTSLDCVNRSSRANAISLDTPLLH